jgi:Tol biopolymer transport system component
MRSLKGPILVSLLLLTGCSGSDQDRPDIVFQSSRDGNFEIYTMRGDGNNQRRLTDNPANDLSPSWAPGNSAIVFSSDRDGNWDLYTIRPDGSGLTRLTKGTGANTSPSWALSGAKILFISTRVTPNGNIYLMNADGTGVEQVSDDSLVKDSPVMTNDGGTIIATVTAAGGSRIAAFRRIDKTWHYLTAPGTNSVHPALSRDGASILYSTNQDGNYEIYSMDIAGLQQTRLTRSPAPDLYPAWTSTAGEILLSRSGSIYRLQAATQQEQILSYKGDSAPQWRTP